jgi:hypothetical protein
VLFTSLDFDPFNKIILVGTNLGSVLAFELESAKQSGMFIEEKKKKKKDPKGKEIKEE